MYVSTYVRTYVCIIPTYLPTYIHTFFLHIKTNRAAAFSHLDIIHLLLKMGANVNAADYANVTPFLSAVKHGSTEAAELLLESGADLRFRDTSFRTGIHLAVLFKHLDTLRMLLRRDELLFVNEGDKELRTALHYAAYLGNIKVAM